MFIKQISIFVENRPGRMNEVIRLLAENEIDLSALSLSDSANFGVLRLLVEDTEAAVAKLRSVGCTLHLTDVIALGVDDKPGALTTPLDVLSTANINIEYMYAFLSQRPDRAYVVLRVDDAEAAVYALQKAGIEPANAEELFSKS